jgi:hypothetical protein
MKYVLFDWGETDCVIVTEHGGVACAHHNGDHIVSEYYQESLCKGDLEGDRDIWEILGEGKLYSNDWVDSEESDTYYPLKTKIDDEVVKDLREWLVPENDEGFTEYRMKWDDDYTFLKTFIK